MSRFVYMISNHDDYGSENCMVTLHRDNVLNLLDKWFKVNNYVEERFAEYIQECKKKLEEYLKLEDSVCQHNLGTGWGGVQFHIIEIADANDTP